MALRTLRCVKITSTANSLVMLFWTEFFGFMVVDLDIIMLHDAYSMLFP